MNAGFDNANLHHPTITCIILSDLSSYTAPTMKVPWRARAAAVSRKRNERDCGGGGGGLGDGDGGGGGGGCGGDGDGGLSGGDGGGGHSGGAAGVGSMSFLLRPRPSLVAAAALASWSGERYRSGGGEGGDGGGEGGEGGDGGGFGGGGDGGLGGGRGGGGGVDIHRHTSGIAASALSTENRTTSLASSTDIATWCQRSSLKCGTRGEIAVHTTPLWYAVKLSVESGIMSNAM